MWAIKSLYHRVAEAGIKAILRKIEFVNIPCAEFNVPDPMHPRVFFGPSEFLITQIDTDYAAYLFSNAQRDTAATTTDIQNSKLWCQVRIQKLSVVVGASAGHVFVKVCTHALDTWVAMAGNVPAVPEPRMRLREGRMPEAGHGRVSGCGQPGTSGFCTRWIVPENPP